MKNEETHIQLFKSEKAAVERLRGSDLNTAPEVFEAPQRLDIATSWMTIRRHKWLSAGIFLFILAAVAVWTFSQTPVYRARVMLEIEKENPSIVTAQDLFTLDSVTDVYLETQYRVLESDSLAQQVIDELGLASVPEFSETPLIRWPWSKKRAVPLESTAGQGLTDQQQKESPASKTLDGFRDRLKITPIRRSRLIEISFDSRDPALAARVVNTFASDYIQRSLQTRRDDSQKVSELLSEKLEDARLKLQESQGTLQNYARANGLLFLDGTTSGATPVSTGTNETLVSERLRRVQEELSTAQAARNEKESMQRLIKNGNYASLPGVFDNRLIQDLSVQLADLQRQSAQLTATFSPNYFRVKEIQNQIKETQANLERERNRAVERISQDYQAAVNRVAFASRDYEQQRRDANLIAQRLTQFNTLKEDVDANKRLQEDLAKRVKEASFSSELSASKIRVVDPARTPHSPITPRTALNLGLGTLVGLVLAIGVAFVRENADTTVKSPEQVQYVFSLPTLAAIPTMRLLTNRRAELIAGGNGGKSSLALSSSFSNEIASRGSSRTILTETFRSLCTSLRFSSMTAGRLPASMLIASTRPGEGKTMVATNLSITLAELGEPVLLIDADMRRPKLQDAFGMSSKAGLSAYLMGSVDWRSAVRTTTIPGLNIILCGDVHPNPVRLLSTDRMAKLIEEAGREYKHIIIDSPPVLNVADSRILAGLVEAVILVVKSGATPQVLVQRAETYVRIAGAKIIGVVLNRFNDEPYGRFSSPLYYTPRP